MDSGMCDLSNEWRLWPIIEWTPGKTEREQHSHCFSVCSPLSGCSSSTVFQQKNALTGFPCSLNFHKAYSSFRKMCHILKRLALCNPPHEKWSFMSFAFFYSSRFGLLKHVFSVSLYLELKWNSVLFLLRNQSICSSNRINIIDTQIVITKNR